MPLDDESRELVYQYLSYHLGRPLRSLDDLYAMSAAEFLALMDLLRDEALPYILQLVKEAPVEKGLFQKLMGDHDPDNQEASDRFFARYQAVMMDDLDQEINPLVVYLPPDSWHDLAFLQSRESFFLRQPMSVIEEFLTESFGEIPDFGPDGEIKAWNWFFNKVVLG